MNLFANLSNSEAELISGRHTQRRTDPRGVVAELSLRRIHLMNPRNYTVRMGKPRSTRYRTTNWSSYNASLRKRGSLVIWAYKEMSWLTPCDGRRGGIGCRQCSACLERWHSLQKADNLIGAQDIRELTRRSGIGDRLLDLCPIQRDAVKEAQRAHPRVQCAPVNPLRYADKLGRRAHPQGPVDRTIGRETG